MYFAGGNSVGRAVTGEGLWRGSYLSLRQQQMRCSVRQNLCARSVRRGGVLGAKCQSPIVVGSSCPRLKRVRVRVRVRVRRVHSCGAKLVPHKRSATKSTDQRRLFLHHFSSKTSSSDPHVGIVTPEHIEAYCRDMTTPESPRLQQVSEASQIALEQAHMVCGHLPGQLLKTLVHLTQSRRVLEIGTYTGYSAFAMLEAQHAVAVRAGQHRYPSRFQLVCVDPFTDEAASEAVFLDALSREPHKEHVRLFRTTGQEALQQLSKELEEAKNSGTATAAAVDGDDHTAAAMEDTTYQDVNTQPFDMVFIDADKESQIEYYEMLVGSPLLLAPRGVIVVDNTLWYGKVCRRKSKRDRTTRDIHRFNEHVVKDTRTQNLLLPVRDGITIIYKV